MRRARTRARTLWCGNIKVRPPDGARSVPTPEDAMRHISRAGLIAAAYACGDGTSPTQPRHDLARVAEARYEVAKLPSLGGTLSRGMAINSQGWVAGWSDLPDGSRRAVLWKDAAITPLATLGGPSSTVPWPGLNDAGLIAGISQTGDADPLDEEWSCELGDFLLETTDLLCRGFVWEHDVMRELPTLGGNHGFAAGVK